MNFGYLFSPYTHCVRCGTISVTRAAKRDRIDSVSRNILSRIQHLLGAPLNKCAACRLQYYDWRRAWTPANEEAAATSPATRLGD